MKTEHKNFIYNVVYQLLIYVFPLITIPYVSRVLGVSNIGIYSYTYSIVYIFMLVAQLGINNYGNREIARHRDNKIKRSHLFLSIYTFQVITTFIMIIGYCLFLLSIEHSYLSIFYIQLVLLISVLFDINWFYFGLEKFKITITRNLIIKFLSVIFIFLFVKEKDDLWKYSLILAVSTLLSQIYLFTILPKYVKFVKFSLMDVLSHFKGILVLFIPVVSFAVYRVMDKTMIGYFSSVTELGYYENAERIINIPISIITALGTVMLPRMSYLYNNSKSGVDDVLHSSMKLALILASIMTCGALFISDDISLVLFGTEFAKSGNIIKILSFTILASAWANVIRTQYLIPKGEDRIYVKSTIGGAITNLICNIIFIPIWGAYGACIGTLVAEFFVALYQSYCVRKILPVFKYCMMFLSNFVRCLLIMTLVILLGNCIETLFARFVFEIIFALSLFMLFYYRYITKEFLH